MENLESGSRFHRDGELVFGYLLDLSPDKTGVSVIGIRCWELNNPSLQLSHTGSERANQLVDRWIPIPYQCTGQAFIGMGF
jgi:hypothetical protein